MIDYELSETWLNSSAFIGFFENVAVITDYLFGEYLIKNVVLADNGGLYSVTSYLL